MKVYMIILLLVLVAMCGCSLVTAPAYAYLGDNQDVWPAFFGTDNSLKDNGYFVTYDQGASAFDAPLLIAGDLLVLQQTPQRNAVCYETDGTYYVSFVEDTNDLEIYECPTNNWDVGAGAWGVLDDDVSETWLAVDAETRQNYVWLGLYYEPLAGNNILFEIDLAAGVPALTASTITPLFQPADSSRYSIVLDQSLVGCVHYVNINSRLFHCPAAPDGIWNTIDTLRTGDYPQIVTDGEQRLWIFFTTGNILGYTQASDDAQGTIWDTAGTTVFTANTLDDDYHATWLKMDDTIHVVLVDFNLAANSTTLNYLRRTPNGWDAPVVLLTVDSDPLGDLDSLEFPQITVGSLGAIFIYYILNPDWSAGVGGDLQGFYLDAGVYSAPVVGNWIQHTNIDADVDGRVLWVVAPDSIPISGDM